MKALVIVLGLAGCSVVPVVATMENPNADAGDKTCAVLTWGIPLAESRLPTLGPRAAVALADAKQILAAGCQPGNLDWRSRAVAAGSELAALLWKTK